MPVFHEMCWSYVFYFNWQIDRKKRVFVAVIKPWIFDLLSFRSDSSNIINFHECGADICNVYAYDIAGFNHRIKQQTPYREEEEEEGFFIYLHSCDTVSCYMEIPLSITLQLLCTFHDYITLRLHQFSNVID
jgi:hypothetical protein